MRQSERTREDEPRLLRRHKASIYEMMMNLIDSAMYDDLHHNSRVLMAGCRKAQKMKGNMSIHVRKSMTFIYQFE